MKQDTRYQVNPVVSCGEEEDGAVLYNPDRDITSVINLTALNLWFFLHAPRSRNEIVEHLVQTYTGVTTQQATEDTESFIKILTPDFLLELDNDN